MTDFISKNACLIVEGIAFEVASGTEKTMLSATDLSNLNYKASFAIRGREFVLSVSSFREKEREQAMLEAVRINSALLLDEVQCA
jgi:hypothetical protein